MHSDSKPIDSSFVLSLITSDRPLGKELSITPEDKLHKKFLGHMTNGRVQKRLVHGPRELVELLGQMQNTQAFCYGVCPFEEAEVVTQKALKAEEDKKKDIVARDRAHFRYRSRNAIWMLDVDLPDGADLSSEELLEKFYEINPALKKAPMVVFPSSSSFIYNKSTGSPLTGCTGWRVLVLVASGLDIPRAGNAFFQRCWLNGEGWIKISKAGTLLVRGLIDAAVFQPERLDLVAGAVCIDPLEQRPEKPILINPDAEPFDTQKYIHDLNKDEVLEYVSLVREAKIPLEAEAQRVRANWVEEMTTKRFSLLPDEDQTEARWEEIRRGYYCAAQTLKLGKDFILRTEEGEDILVAEILSDPKQWHERRFYDPFDSDDGADCRVACLYSDKRPIRLHSFAGGGVVYSLEERTTVREIPAYISENLREVVSILMDLGTVFQRGGELVYVDGDEIVPFDQCKLQNLLDEIIAWKRSGAKGKYVPCNVPQQIADRIVGGDFYKKFPELRCVIGAPALSTKSKRIIQAKGFDAETGVFLTDDSCENMEYPQSLPTGALRRGVSVIWEPFKDFPYETAYDRSALLAAVFTAVLRPLLPTAPAFFMDSHSAGSGKTLLAICLGILSGLDKPSVLSLDSNELRQELLLFGREGGKAIIVDNIDRLGKSNELCAWITNPTFSGRPKYGRKIIDVPTNSLCVLTGNNVDIAGDLNRRIFKIRISPDTEQPWAREFDLEPDEYCRDNRLQMINAALCIVRVAMHSGLRLNRGIASFKDWSNSARLAVCWLAEQEAIKDFFSDCDGPALVDPILCIERAYEDDPELIQLKAVLSAWFDAFGDKPVSVSEVLKSDEMKVKPLQGLLDEYFADGGTVNPQRVGTWLRRVQGRFCDGMKIFREQRKRGNSGVWRVIRKGGTKGS